MGINSYLRWLTVTSLVGVLVVAAVGFAALFRIEVNGPVYRDIALSKDLVADYVPPSQSLLQIAIICGMLVDNPSDSSARSIEIDAFEKAKAAFEAQHAAYMNQVPEGPLKNLMRGDAHVTGRQYIEIAEQFFIPAIKRGALDEAHQILVFQLTPIFDKHAKAVDQIVTLAKKEAADGETESAASVRFYTGVMIAVVMVTLVAVGTFSTFIARAIGRQANEMRISNQALRVLSECNSAVAKATDEKALLTAVCSILVDQAGFERARVECTEPKDEPAQDARSLAIPLRQDGKAFGAIVVHTARPEGFGAQTVSLLEELSATLATGILALRAQAERNAAQVALEQSRAELEERVLERTSELLVSKDKAESADRIKSAFLATMSHELRTPLNSIIGFTGICLQELPGPLNAEQKTQLGMVQTSARHLLALINDVLDISKIEAGQLEVRLEPFDVRKTVERVVEVIRPLAEKKGLSLYAEIAPAVGKIASDRRRVEQILLNLLSNAVKFTNQGAVGVKCAVDGGWLTTSVSDTGIGIAGKELGLLFLPFRQLDSGLARKHEGTGLGLSICKRLSEILGGSISVESRPGEGSTFSYRLPLGYF